ncbi:thioesterase family protein [Dactylosporangium sp. CA-233914]|uniref:thioesterase family protein n=1 Tax=Dactylosporangium sp. CA-233914 TaxID=3239934 RepID=UPI003D8EF48A
MRDVPENRSASLSREVTDLDVAARFGDAFPPAAATPFVLGLAEVACHQSVSDYLEAQETTVGIEATIRHLAPSPVGAVLTAHARLVKVDRRTLSFTVTVMDGDIECAQVEHTRAAVLTDRINQRLDQRRADLAAPRASADAPTDPDGIPAP